MIMFITWSITCFMLGILSNKLAEELVLRDNLGITKD